VVDSWSCSISSPTLTCTIHYTDGSPSNTNGPYDARPDIKLEIFLSNASGAFADAPSGSPVLPEDIAMFRADGVTPPVGWNSPPYGYWSNIGSVVPTVAFVGGTLTYTGRLQNAGDQHNATVLVISLPVPGGYLPRLTNPSTTAPNIDWFISNQWYRQTYYAVAPGWVPSGSGACSPPTCLTVNNLAAPTNNKRAILVLAGRALDGQTHPSGNPADYLEGQNATPADLIFEHRAGSPTTINDRVVVVSP
jgi:hypothetical protein